ncbi:hypothetical protein ACH347_42775 [Saccharopolyspora sp. 5N102]|uniref:hypothetical protein n=1 Tax=Saccharopolyspora sp. 5N102 TaxID=3375155 RepID=UPI0037AFAA8E
MDVVADIPEDTQAAVPMRQRDVLFDHLSVHAQPGVVLGAAPGELGADSLGAYAVAVIVVVNVNPDWSSLGIIS